MNVIAPNQTTVPAAQAFPFEREIIEWDLETAIERIKPKVENFKRSAADLAKELFIAHEVLAVRGGDRRTEDAPLFTWSDFCDIIGLSRKTAGLYMKLYDPVEDRVRTPEEMVPLRQAPQLDDGGHEMRVARAMATGERMSGWTDADEKEFKVRKANEHFAELARKWGSKKIKTNFKGRDYFSEAMANAKQYSRFSLQTKEQSLAQFEVFDHLTDYLKSFEDPGTRLAAGYNIGLRVREIINDLAGQLEELNQYSGPGEEE